MRSTREGSVACPSVAPSGGDNVTMQQLMETMHALQEAVAAFKVDEHVGRRSVGMVRQSP